MTINRELLKNLRDEINAALAGVAAKHDLTILAGNASFTANEATFKLNVSAGAGKTSAEVRLGKLANNLEFLKLYYPDVDTTATYCQNANRFKIVGYNTRAPKAPVMIQNQEGKAFKCSVEHLSRMRKIPA